MNYFIETDKFGGASLWDTYSMGKFFEHMSFDVKRPTLIVVSAFKGITNMLEMLASYLHEGDKGKAKEQKQKLLEFHFEIAYNLFPQESKVFEKIMSVLNSIDIKKYLRGEIGYLYGQIVGKGEDLSSLIISEYLKLKEFDNILVNSRDFVFTDGISDSNILLEKTKAGIANFFNPSFFEKNPSIVIMQGFIGTDAATGNPAVLKREYSDVSAVVMALSLNTELNFWKKRGVIGNPAEISVAEFLELEKGKDLLADTALKLLAENKKSFSVIPFDDPQKKTLIHF